MNRGAGDMTRRSILSRVSVALFAAIVAGVLSAPVEAQEVTTTRVMVRALSHDAKVIGSNVGGARIVIEEAASGRVLAEGIQEGGTGDTRLIMDERPRRGAFSTESTAGFLATIELDQPTLVDITAVGPLGTPDGQVQSTKRMLLVPGVDVLGDGVILELNGLTVELLSPTAPTLSGEELAIRARVTMLCGCPTEPGGRWDADQIRVLARLLSNGEAVAESDLAFAGETSVFSGALDAPRPGDYELEILAMDPTKANFGREVREVSVAKNGDTSGVK